MQAHLVQTFINDAELADFFPGRAPETWFLASHTLGVGPVPADPPKPWLAWLELAATPFAEVRKTSNAKIRNFQIFVYDDEGDYTRINNIMNVIERIVKNMAPFTDSEGTRCSDSEFVGISGNLPASQYDGACRFGTARFVVSQ
jgi:hypothetical protein